jgi:uncharacterized RDD family membrane protein YckC
MDAIVGLLPLAAAFHFLRGSPEGSQTTIARVAVWLSATVIILIAQMAFLSVRGQTLGKMALGVRVVAYDDESNPGFMRAALLRWLVPGLVGAIPCLGALFLLADVLCIVGEERRCIHDLIADTKVVQC